MSCGGHRQRVHNQIGGRIRQYAQPEWHQRREIGTARPQTIECAVVAAGEHGIGTMSGKLVKKLAASIGIRVDRPHSLAKVWRRGGEPPEIQRIKGRRRSEQRSGSDMQFRCGGPVHCASHAGLSRSALSNRSLTDRVSAANPKALRSGTVSCRRPGRHHAAALWTYLNEFAPARGCARWTRWPPAPRPEPGPSWPVSPLWRAVRIRGERNERFHIHAKVLQIDPKLRAELMQPGELRIPAGQQRRDSVGCIVEVGATGQQHAPQCGGPVLDLGSNPARLGAILIGLLGVISELTLEPLAPAE